MEMCLLSGAHYSIGRHYQSLCLPKPQGLMRKSQSFTPDDREMSYYITNTQIVFLTSGLCLPGEMNESVCDFIHLFQVNDFVRDKFMDKNGNLPLYGEIISGACVSIHPVNG